MSIRVRRNFPRLDKLVAPDRGIIRDLLLLTRERIIRRTLSGRDESGNSFRPYAASTKRQRARRGKSTSTVNLQDTNTMLGGIAILQVTARRGRLGFKGGEAGRRATAHHRGIGVPRRAFFGVTDEDEKAAIDRFKAWLDRRI